VAFANTRVIVNLHVDATQPGFTVHDDGPGFPVEEHSNLLKPFQRGSDPIQSGYGLGLAVVSRIATHHQANLEITTSEVLGGAKVSVFFNHGPG